MMHGPCRLRKKRYLTSYDDNERNRPLRKHQKSSHWHLLLLLWHPTIIPSMTRTLLGHAKLVWFQCLSIRGLSMTHPDSDLSSPFWMDLRYDIFSQIHRLENGSSTSSSVENWLGGRVPSAWQNFTMTQVAEAVHDEYHPGSIHAVLVVIGTIPCSRERIECRGCWWLLLHVREP